MAADASRMSPMKSMNQSKMTQSVMGPDLLRSQISPSKKSKNKEKRERIQEKRKKSKERKSVGDHGNNSENDAYVDVNDDLQIFDQKF